MKTYKIQKPKTKITIAKGTHQNPEKLTDNLNKIQLIDSKKINSHQEILHSTILAKKSMKNNTNIANNLYIEILLYLSKQRQIKQALNKLGVNKNTNKFYLITLQGKKHLKTFINKNNINITKTKPKKIKLQTLKKNIEESAMLKVTK